MNIMTYLKKGIFYAYMAYVIFMYTRPVSIDRYLEKTSGLDLDKIFHFLTFLLLGILAQITNNRTNDNIYAVTLALIVSLFIEFTLGFTSQAFLKASLPCLLHEEVVSLREDIECV